MAALLWGVWTYKRNGEAKVRLLALETLYHYLDLAVAHPDLVIRDESQSVDLRLCMVRRTVNDHSADTQSLTVAQTLWLLGGRRPNWQ